MKSSTLYSFTSLAILYFMYAHWKYLQHVSNSYAERFRTSPEEWRSNDVLVNIKSTAALIHFRVCNTQSGSATKHLCTQDYFKKAGEELLQGNNVHMVQIGAHVGFEKNDPLGSAVVTFLQLVSGVSSGNITQNFHWTFVEPSPPNYERLKQNLESRKGICDMRGVNAGILPDSPNVTSRTPFYSFAPSIDPESGYDSLSGKMLPAFITQVSGFDMAPLEYNRDVFTKQGLNMDDYVVKSQVSMLDYSELMKEHVRAEQGPLLLMIDTEGYDCNIVEGIQQHSKWLPQFIIFEISICNPLATFRHLEMLGYDTIKAGENAIGTRRQ